MNCVECNANNPHTNRFCGHCGSELGHTLAETVRHHREQRTTEWEITEAVTSRLMKWARWLGSATFLVLAAFGFAFHLIYRDTRTVLDTAKTEIEKTVSEGKININNAVAAATKDVHTISSSTTGLGEQVVQLKSDINGYKEVNSEMQTLQKQFHGQTSDLTKLDLRVHTLETVGGASEINKPAQLILKRPGCQAPPGYDGIAPLLCTQGSPLLFYERQGEGVRPIASLSPTGFQDVSTAPRPGCDGASRGTLYIEKGSGHTADKPLLCGKKSDGSYAWVQMGTLP